MTKHYMLVKFSFEFQTIDEKMQKNLMGYFLPHPV